MLIEKFLHNCGEYSLRDCGADIDVMLTVLKDLWLDDWYETVLLADGTVSGEGVSVLSDGGLGWAAIADLEDSSPFCESASQCVILSASLTKSIKSLCSSLGVGSSDWDETRVDLNTAMNASSSENIYEFLGAIGSGIADSLVKHDYATNMLVDVWSREKELSVCLSVGVVVLDADAIESLANRPGRLVSSKDSLTRSADFLSSLDELGLEVAASV